MYNGAKVWKSSVETSVYLPTGQPIPCVLLVNKVRLGEGRKQENKFRGLEWLFQVTRPIGTENWTIYMFRELDQ